MAHRRGHQSQRGAEPGGEAVGDQVRDVTGARPGPSVGVGHIQQGGDELIAVLLPPATWIARQ
ncbi:hypothetical protein [Candidatus Frankia alpina]|uniref:hypothetical protein n=1 Tax=Candidatus Frankia alpina TaxID=2699483 RepID=UPI001F327701|nr:hypothetical protein [Candidatus Frankia alpina]